MVIAKSIYHYHWRDTARDYRIDYCEDGRKQAQG